MRRSPSTSPIAPISSRRAASSSRAKPTKSAGTRRSGAPISDTRARGIGMELLLQQIFAGLATGTIYACIALAIVMIYQAIGQLNFAQGEMAMFSTFVAWQLMQWGAPYWVAFLATIALSFAFGVAIDRIVFRPIHNAPVLSHVVVFIAMLAILNSGAGFIWDYQIKAFPSPFGSGALFGQNLISRHDAGMTSVTLMMLVLLYFFFRHTRIGLAMR